MDVRHLVRRGGWGQEHAIAHRTDETVNCQLSKSLFLVLEAGVAETMPQASYEVTNEGIFRGPEK